MKRQVYPTCPYCDQLLTENNFGICDKQRILKLIKEKCVICNRKADNKERKGLTRYLTRGNWCSKCVAKATIASKYSNGKK